MDTIAKRAPMSKKSSRAASKRSRRGGNDSSVKVVYISSPMKVKTSASRFRALVQELTGRDSDIETLMTMDGGANYNRNNLEDLEAVPDELFGGNNNSSRGAVSSFSMNHHHHRHLEEEKPTSSNSPASSSESLSENLDDLFLVNSSHRHQSIMGEEEQFMFPLDFLYNSSEIDVLGSYDAVL